MKIGQLIKAERQKINMRQDELSKSICSASYLSKIEKGTAIPGDDIQQLLLQRLNIPLENTFSKSSPEEFTQFNKRFKDVINRRDKIAAELLFQEIHFFLENNPLYNYKINLLLMETRLMLTISADFTAAKKNVSIVLPMHAQLSYPQLFNLYIIQGLIAYLENHFTNALHLFTNASSVTKEYRVEDWEIAELHYISSLAALSDYRYTLVIDHVQEAITYFHKKVLVTRSIECILILGIAQKQTGNVDDALVTFKNAKEVMTNTEATRFLGILEQNIGTCYSLLQDSERSLHHFNQSLLTKADPNKQIISYLAITKEHKKIGDLETAKVWVHKGITLLNQLTEQNKVSYGHHFAIYKALLYNEHHFSTIFEAALDYFESKQNYYRCFVYCNIFAKKSAENNQFKLATVLYQRAFDYHLKHRKVHNWEELT